MDFSSSILTFLVVLIASLIDVVQSRKVADKYIQLGNDVTTFVTTEHRVFNMAEDLLYQGQIIYSDGHALMSTDGVTTDLIVGDPNSWGYIEGRGKKARFDFLDGFVQIDPGLVVAVDRYNECLRSINRISKQTQPFVGLCENSGSSDDVLSAGTARFNSPRDVIINNQNSSVLYVTDEYNDAIRLVNIKTKMVSTLVKVPNLKKPRGMTQDDAGDLYVVTNHALMKVIMSGRDIQVKTLSGSTTSAGFLDGDSSKAMYNKPYAVVQLNPVTFLLADYENRRLRILDLISGVTTSLCTGNLGHIDGPYTICTISNPSSLLMVGTTVYIGEYERIRKITGGKKYTPISAALQQTSTKPRTRPTVSTLSTTTALTRPTTRASTRSTGKQKQSPTTEKPCASRNESVVLKIGQKYAEVYVTRTQKLIMQAGNHIYHVISEGGKICTININVIRRDSQKMERLSRVAQVSIGSISMVTLAGEEARRRLEFQAEYQLSDCSVMYDSISRTAITNVANHNYNHINDICSNVCGKTIGVQARIECKKGTLLLTWPTSLTYPAAVKSLPTATEDTLTQQLKKKGELPGVIILNRNPPIIFPKQLSNGAYAKVILTPYCEGGLHYSSSKDTCLYQNTA